MKMRWEQSTKTCGVFACIIVGASAMAQGVPEEIPYNQHAFFSAPTTMAHDWNEVFYKVCNDSGGNSSFRWYGPGFGVSSLAELDDDWCALKTVSFDSGSSDVFRSKVTFLGGPSKDNIPAWLPPNPSRWIYSQIKTRITDADGQAPMAAINVTSNRNENGSGEIRITAGNYFDEIIVIFPEASVNEEELLASLQPDFRSGEVSVTNSTTIGDFNTNELLNANELEEGVPLLVVSGDEGTRGLFSVENFDLLGKQMWLFAGNADGMWIRNDILLPIGPS